ncbi:MAG: Rpn family recombination-promoting nuclease/putative transposase [Candidatus Fibromonas sp.]|jgi:predicted transposase YdaD|nr:Rpn family recombination-promoting nuclease/putative transposase [Candidatus Fibromonas sp.]
METVKTNRKYKSSVFAALFSEKENLLELYNAIENTNYGKDTEIIITTLEDVLFMEQQNDISFVIDGKIVVLIEHQSTVNNNMPLRALMYLARTYEKIVREDNLYREGIIPLPKPEIIVLYNGEDDMPEQQILKLSDMFMDYCKEEIPNLECIVKVININKGHNEELAQRSTVLSGYGKFVYLVREYAKSMDRSAAIVRAIDDCIRGNVLKDFLERNASEVRNMLFARWDWDVAKRVWQEEAEERGREKGVAIGEARGVAIGREEGVLRTARQMKAKGLNVALIAEVTGLLEEDIERLDICG